MSQPTETSQAIEIRDAVIEAYLETGAALDVAQIATRMGCSPTKVRRIMAASNGCVAGLETRQANRENQSNMVSGSHKVWVYAPSKQTLREIILDLRKAATS